MGFGHEIATAATGPHLSTGNEVNAITPKTDPVPAVSGTPDRGLADGLPRQIVELVESSLDDDKAEDIVIIDLDGKSTIADYMIVASGRSSRQVGSMADHLSERLKKAGLGPVKIEGRVNGDWVLLDAGDVIVHLFRPEVRAFYNIEKMWDASSPPMSGRA